MTTSKEAAKHNPAMDVELPMLKSRGPFQSPVIASPPLSKDEPAIIHATQKEPLGIGFKMVE